MSNVFDIDNITAEIRVTENADILALTCIVNENFKIFDELRDCKRLFDGLNDTLSTSWDAMYEVAKIYYTEQKNPYD